MKGRLLRMLLPPRTTRRPRSLRARLARAASTRSTPARSSRPRPRRSSGKGRRCQCCPLGATLIPRPSDEASVVALPRMSLGWMRTSRWRWQSPAAVLAARPRPRPRPRLTSAWPSRRPSHSARYPLPVNRFPRPRSRRHLSWTSLLTSSSTLHLRLLDRQRVPSGWLTAGTTGTRRLPSARVHGVPPHLLLERAAAHLSPHVHLSPHLHLSPHFGACARPRRHPIHVHVAPARSGRPLRRQPQPPPARHSLPFPPRATRWRAIHCQCRATAVRCCRTGCRVSRGPPWRLRWQVASMIWWARSH